MFFCKDNLKHQKILIGEIGIFEFPTTFFNLCGTRAPHQKDFSIHYVNFIMILLSLKC